MKIVIDSVFVADQAKALKFYTEVLGFVKKTEIPDARWITVISPEQPDGPELLLEPNENPVAQAYQKGLVEQGIAATSFAVDDAQKEFERLKKLGVRFTQEPTNLGPVTIAMLDDTCGNLIQIAQHH
jgi:catechol 2,3-dioxygenase-like lactoylglutathione lyase family enzyme